jgi:hypothetical protein
MTIKRPNNTLTHFGILGMHWGRRTGKTPTTDSSDHVTTTAIKKKKLSQMSNAEIKKLSERLQLEKSYKELSKKQVSDGERIVKESLVNGAKQALTPIIAENTAKIAGFIISAAISAARKKAAARQTANAASTASSVYNAANSAIKLLGSGE